MTMAEPTPKTDKDKPANRAAARKLEKKIKTAFARMRARSIKLGRTMPKKPRRPPAFL